MSDLQTSADSSDLRLAAVALDERVLLWPLATVLPVSDTDGTQDN